MLRVINESNYEREHKVPSILQFGFILLEPVRKVSCKKLCNFVGLMNNEELGIQMLKTLFKVYDMSRDKIVKQIKFHNLLLKLEMSRPTIKVLYHFTQCYPYFMLEYILHLKELLVYFTFLNGKIIFYLVSALLHLIIFNYDLLYYIILSVCKAVFVEKK